MTEGSGETRLSDQIAYHRSLCDAAQQAFDDNAWFYWADNSRPWIKPDVVSALLDVIEAAAQVTAQFSSARNATENDVPGVRVISALAASLDALSRRLKEQP